MSTPALNVKNLSIELKTDRGPVRLVDSISFHINAGQTLGLVGESGCGKTMTVMAIMGLLREQTVSIQSNGIEVNGLDISTLTPRQRRAVLGRDISMVFQQPGTALDPVFTIGQQLAKVHSRHIGGSQAATRSAVLESLEQAGFKEPGDTAKSYPHQLSGGMRQLAMIAMAMMAKPAVMVADEPTTALDASSRVFILQRIQSLQEMHNTAVLMVSHDLSTIRQICNRVMVMYCGRIVEACNSRTLFSQARHPYTAGLLACIPTIDAERKRRVRAIPGQVPALAELSGGCHFAPRCERAELKCKQSTPPVDSTADHMTACFRPLS